MFLLIVWEFHTIYPDHPDFPVLPALIPHPFGLHPAPLKFFFKRVQLVLFIYSSEHAQTTGGQPLKEKWVLPHPTTKSSHPLQRATFQHLYHNFLEFSLMASCAGWYLLRGGYGLSQNPPMSLFLNWKSLWSLMPLQKNLPVPSSQQEDGSKTYAGYLVTVRTMGIHLTSCISTSLGPQHGPQWHSGPLIPVWSPVSAWSTDINMTSGRAQTTDIHMTLGGNPGHKHRLGQWLQHGPRASVWSWL